MARVKKLKWQVMSRTPGRESVKAQTHLGEFWASNINGAFTVIRRHIWDNDSQDDILSYHLDMPTAKQAANDQFAALVKSLIY